MPQPLLLDTSVSAPPGAFAALVVPVVLGAAAIYLLLPRPRRFPLWLGAGVAALALLTAGFLLVQVTGVWVETVCFYAFAGVAVTAGGLLVTQRNPVRAALSFALVVLSTCGLFLLQAAPFLMAATIIIYAGAIIVTFLFVIMLAQQAGLSDADARSREPLLSCIAGFVLLGTILFLLHSAYSTRNLDALLQTTAHALEQPSAEGMQNALGEKRDFFERYHREAERQTASPVLARQLAGTLNEVEAAWQERPDAVALRRALTGLHEATLLVRNRQGGLEPPGQLPLSPYSRPRPDADALPAVNVAYLGRALFTDYLLGVELGGTLLLVATIGAIVIAGRRVEGLR